MRAGVIDIGSSSIKLIIGEVEAENIKILEHLKNIVPIGKNAFYKGSITPETTTQIAAILEKYKQILKEYDVGTTLLIATTAVREARNKDIFIDTIKRASGLSVEVLTAGDVVYYIDSYLYYRLKNTYPIHDKNVLIAELGAGSLDVSVIEKGLTQLNLGLPIGTLRLQQLMARLGGSLTENCEAVKEYIANEFAYLKSNIPRMHIDDVILIDEKYPPYLQNIIPAKKKEADFFRISEEDTRAILAEISDKSPEEIAHNYSLPQDIADSFTAYAAALNAFFGLIQNKYIYVLETSLSEAILANMLLGIELTKKYNKANQLISMAHFIGKKYNVDIGHAKNTAELSKAIFDGLKEKMGLRDEELLYLTLAAYLHDIGSFLHNRSHHKHSEYIINSLNLFRLTEEEIAVIACIARYHRKSYPVDTHILYNSLNLDKQILVQKLSAILRIANSLDSSHCQKVKKLEVKSSGRDIALTVNAAGNFLLEKADFLENKDFFEEITGAKVSLTVKE